MRNRFWIRIGTAMLYYRTHRNCLGTVFVAWDRASAAAVFRLTALASLQKARAAAKKALQEALSVRNVVADGQKTKRCW